MGLKVKVVRDPLKSDLMPKETQSTLQTDKEETVHQRAEEVIDKINLAEEEEELEETVTEEVVLEPTKPLLTSKRVKTLPKKRRLLKNQRLNQSQLLKWKLLVSQLMISLPERQRLPRNKLKQVKVSKDKR